MLEKPVLEVVKENYDKFFVAQKKVADVILQDPQKAVHLNVSELAQESGVSDATVVRMCHTLGYKGYYQFRLLLANDLGRENARADDIVQDESNAIMRVFREYSNSMLAIGENINEQDLWECVGLIKTCKQAHILAVGNTTPLALYMGFRLGRLGVKCTYGIAAEYFMNTVNLADKEDIVIAISQSGASRQVIQGIELAKEKSLKVIAITGYKKSPISELSDYALISNGRKESLDYYKGYAHLNETAIVDALIEFVTNWERIKELGADKPEIILSEYKY